mgnify:CR=1 FL=1
MGSNCIHRTDRIQVRTQPFASLPVNPETGVDGAPLHRSEITFPVIALDPIDRDMGIAQCLNILERELVVMNLGFLQANFIQNLNHPQWNLILCSKLLSRIRVYVKMKVTKNDLGFIIYICIFFLSVTVV